MIISIAESANLLQLLSELHPAAQVAAVVAVPLAAVASIWSMCKYL